MNVAVIGIGKLGQRHLDKWLEIEGVTVVGVVGRRDAELTRISQEYDTHPYKSITTLLSEQEVDVFDICTPTHTHHHFIKEAAKIRKDIICEKPMTLTYAEAEEIMTCCERQGVSLFIGHTLEFFPIYEMTKKHISKGLLGDSLQIQMARGVPYPAEAREWYVDESKSGGLFLDLGVHEFEWLLATCGDVLAVSTSHVKHDSKGTIIYGLITLTFANNWTAIVELSWDEPAFRASFSVQGDHGKISYDNKKDVPVVSGQNETQLTYDTLSQEDPYVRQLTHFKECLEGNASPLLSTVHAAKAVQIAELARKSVTEGIQYLKEK